VKYFGGHCTALGPPRTGCDTIEEMYSYNIGGATVGKRVRLIRGSNQADLNGSGEYDNEGRVTMVTYPSWGTGNGTVGSNYTYAYDTMGRLNTMTDTRASSTLISGVTYGVANEVQAITGTFFNETRSYNSLFQLAQITVPGALNIQYAYSSTQNNGKVISQTDAISGEQVVYTYDALNRLATAQTVTNPNVTQWGQSYNYDGFGNLTDQNVIKGSAPTMHVTYNASTNRQTGDTADANGNLGSGYFYDIANRLLQPSGTTVQYAYDSANKRVWRGGGGLDEIAFWGVNGQKLATYEPAGTYFTLAATDVYFGSRLIAKGTYNSSCPHLDCVTLTSVATDRLGSIGKFYPFGQERPSATQNDTEKFTGYYRDAATGLDYAKSRYEQPGVGRFMSPDPYKASSGPSDPGSWNRYAYVGGDPINYRDPAGLYRDPSEEGGDPSPYEGDWFGLNFPYPGSGGGAQPSWMFQIATNQRAHARALAAVRKKLPTAVGAAEAALNDPKCAALFGQGKLPDGSVVTGATLLFDLSNGIMGFIKPMDLPVTKAVVNGVVQTKSVNAQTSLNNGNLEIDISDVAGSFLDGTVQDQAITLLHEIGHAMNDLFGNGTSGIVNGDDAAKTNIGNTNNVIKDCFPNSPLLPVP
jgi:RHS repeat-associated protein